MTRRSQSNEIHDWTRTNRMLKFDCQTQLNFNWILPQFSGSIEIQLHFDWDSIAFLQVYLTPWFRRQRTWLAGDYSKSALLPSSILQVKTCLYTGRITNTIKPIEYYLSVATSFSESGRKVKTIHQFSEILIKNACYQDGNPSLKSQLNGFSIYRRKIATLIT